MYDDTELAWEAAEREWSGYRLAEQAHGDDELQRAYEAGWDACLAAHGLTPDHAITITESRR